MVPDTIGFMKKDLPAYTLDYNNGQKSDDLYDRSYLEKKTNKVFFFGRKPANYRASSIKNNSARKLLVIKDSYAHCFLPLL